ncbi:MAG TPA: PAS domain S-box protein [candidate division Zixibacteria bacterium]|nr:PAS domain S-box protein [candidate division Zixibacteria bacterium]
MAEKDKEDPVSLAELAQLRQAVERLEGELARRKEAEEALRQSEQRFRLLVEACSDYAIFMLDPAGHVVTWNPGAERVQGYTAAEITGKHYSLFFPPEDRDAGKPDEELKIVAAEGRLETEGWRVRKDGSRYWAHVITTALRDQGGRLNGYAKVIRDLTEHRRAEEALRRSESWLRSLIATTQDAVVSIDRQGRVVLFNRAAERIFGYTAEEIVGRKVNQLMAEPYASEHDAYIARYERTGEARAIGRIRTVTARRKNGELFPIELSVTEIALEDDVHYAAFIRDISDKVRLQSRLVESERLAAIGTTAATIGHELGNPVNGMSLTVQLLERQLRDRLPETEAPLWRTVSRLKDEISRLVRLADRFRTISRKEKYSFRPTDIETGVIQPVVELQEPYFSAMGVQLEVAVPEPLPVVVLDRDKVKQMLINLLKNAAEAMPQGGKITLTATAGNDSVLLEVTDSGTGIPPGIDPFQPFTTTKKDGTGLGLWIVRQIVVAHGGVITYRSFPGTGTTFSIELPCQGPDLESNELWRLIC